MVTNLERTPSDFQVGVAIEGTVLSPSSYNMGTDRLSWSQCQATGSRNWPLGLRKGCHVLGLYQFPASLGTIRKEGASSAQSGRRGEGPPFSGIAAPAGWGSSLLVPVTWSFLQHLAVEIDGRFVVLFSEHQVSQHLSEDTRAVYS